MTIVRFRYTYIWVIYVRTLHYESWRVSFGFLGPYSFRRKDYFDGHLHQVRVTR
jgi:hypothetical protein